MWKGVRSRVLAPKRRIDRLSQLCAVNVAEGRWKNPLALAAAVVRVQGSARAENCDVEAGQGTAYGDITKETLDAPCASDSEMANRASERRHPSACLSSRHPGRLASRITSQGEFARKGLEGRREP
jgi:hypothetical protein